MGFNRPQLVASIVGLGLLATAGAGAETLYFKNKRVLEARSYQVKGPLIYVTLGNGKVVYLRADSVDWEGTERLKGRNVVLRAADYAITEQQEAEAAALAAGGGAPLTSVDLKKGGAGLKLRRIPDPRLEFEVPGTVIWLDSGMNATAGQRLSVRATGEISLGNGVMVGPDGLASTPANSAPMITDLPFGSLIMRVGVGGAAIFAGHATDVAAPASGRVYFGVNDKSTTDNSGSFVVRVRLPNSRPTPAMNTVTPVVVPTAPAQAAPPVGAPAAPSRPPAKGMLGGIDKAKSAAGKK